MESIQDLLTKKYGLAINSANTAFVGKGKGGATVFIKAEELAKHSVESFRAMATRKGYLERDPEPNAPKIKTQVPKDWGI